MRRPNWTDLVKDLDKKMTVMEMLVEYHKAAGQPLNIEPSYLWDYYDLVILRDNLIKEESEEFLEARHTPDKLKEAADLVYVIYGWAATFGYDLDEAIRRVHENNMKRMYQDDGTIHYREDGKVLKNPKVGKPKMEDLV